LKGELNMFTYEFESSDGRCFDITVIDVYIEEQAPNRSTWDSDLDFYGYIDVDFNIGVVEEYLEDGSVTIIADIEKVLSEEDWEDCKDEIAAYIVDNKHRF
jgi:hypothetical protein